MTLFLLSKLRSSHGECEKGTIISKLVGTLSCEDPCRDSITTNEINTKREANLYQLVAQRFDECLSSMPFVSQLSCLWRDAEKQTNVEELLVDDFDALTKELTAKYFISMLTTISWFLVVVDDDAVLTTTDKLEISNNFELKFHFRSSVIARQQNSDDRCFNTKIIAGSLTKPRTKIVHGSHIPAD